MGRGRDVGEGAPVAPLEQECGTHSLGRKVTETCVYTAAQALRGAGSLGDRLGGQAFGSGPRCAHVLFRVLAHAVLRLWRRPDSQGQKCDVRRGAGHLPQPCRQPRHGHSQEWWTVVWGWTMRG